MVWRTQIKLRVSEYTCNQVSIQYGVYCMKLLSSEVAWIYILKPCELKNLYGTTVNVRLMPTDVLKIYQGCL